VAVAALLTALGVVAFRTASALSSGGEVKPAPVAAVLALPAAPVQDVAPPKTEAPPSAPPADLANAFGAALGVEVKDSPRPRAGSPSTPNSSPAAASPPSPDTIDLGSKKDREARLGGHEATSTGIRRLTGPERASKSGSDDKLTFETQLK